MEEMLLVTGQYSDLATITGAIGAGDMALSNLKTQSLQEFYRAIGTTATIDIDFGTAIPIDTIAMMGHSGSVHSYARITAGSNILTPSYDSGNIPFRSHQTSYVGDQSVASRLSFLKNMFMQYLTTPQTHRYWRIEINDPDSAYIDIGRLYLDKAFQPDYNMVWGMLQGFSDASQEYETSSGDSISLKRKKRRIVEFNLEDLSESEAYGQLMVLDKNLGTTGDVLFVLKPDDKYYLQFNSIYGKIEQLQPLAWTSFNRFARQYRIKELLP